MERVFCWGTGEMATAAMSYINISKICEVLGFIDNDTNKQKTSFFGKTVFSPQILREKKCSKIIVLTSHYDEIREQIEDMHLSYDITVEKINYIYGKSILKRYEEDQDGEIDKILRYVEENGLQIFNYDFVEKYVDKHITPVYDSRCQMYYIWHKRKRMYFAKYLDTAEKVERYYRNILIEQDEHSPHRYLDDNFTVDEGDIVVDAGVAEGNFAIDIIDEVSKIYLIEADERWVEALKQTFSAYMDKVVIIPKYLSCVDEGKYTTLDRLVTGPVDFIKMDIEGYECDALLGAYGLFEDSKRLKCAVCSYHNDHDEVVIKHILGDYGMECGHTDGYMWFP